MYDFSAGVGYPSIRRKPTDQAFPDWSVGFRRFLLSIQGGSWKR